MAIAQFWRDRKRRKRVRELLRHVKQFRNLREDLLQPDDLRRLCAAESDVRSLLKERGAADALEQAGEALYRLLLDLSPGKAWSGLRENFEILVVAIAVAMGFRTYFFQPFKIPTGSMEPTLCGIQAAERKPGLFDRMPLKAFKWAVTGQWHLTVRARNSGEFASETDQDRMDGRVYQVCYVGGRRHKLPRGAEPYFQSGDFVRKGDVLWSGIRTSGDHVFVNRIAWNFRPPRREEIIVFRTDGIPIPSAPPGTHYIKRLVALPGETVSIEGDRLVVDEQALPDPRRRAMDKLADEVFPEYRRVEAGMWPVALPETARVSPSPGFSLDQRAYFTLGDNAASSLDSRYWGHVPEANLVGPAAMVYWPLSKRWGAIR